MGAKTPYILAITIVFIYTGMYVISKAAFVSGMNSFVFVFYRQAAASFLLLPIMLLLQRENLRSMSSRLLVKLFLLAFIGNTLSLNLCNASMMLTSATVVSALGNTVPVITFCLALLFRMEVVRFRSSSGIAKVAGVTLCLAGALVIACYMGPSLSPINHRSAFGGTGSSSHPSQAASSRGTWIIGTFVMLLFTITWSLWMVLQAGLLKEYPNKMLVTTAQCVFSTVQCFVVAIVAERNFSRWRLHFDVSLLAIVYTGFVVTGVSYYLQAWCLEIKGPVFLNIWNPATFVLTILFSSLLLAETVHLGSIIGGILLVGGLYSVLWGKSKESRIVVCSDDVNTNFSTQDGQEDSGSREELDNNKENKAGGEASTSVVQQV